MVYELLNDLRDYMACNALPESNSIEQSMLNRIEKVLKTLHKKDDKDYLMPNEILVRICPSTKRPVLVCHSEDGYVMCLHKDTVEEDAEDVKVWLETAGEENDSIRHLSRENVSNPDGDGKKVLDSENPSGFIEIKGKDADIE